MSRSIASGCGVARSVKFQPGLEGSYHKRMRIKIGPSACIDCRVENSQTLLWGTPGKGPLAREFLWNREARGEPSRVLGVARVTRQKTSSNATWARGPGSRV